MGLPWLEFHPILCWIKLSGVSILSFLQLRENLFSFSPLGIMLVVSLSYMMFIMWVSSLCSCFVEFLSEMDFLFQNLFLHLLRLSYAFCPILMTLWAIVCLTLSMGFPWQEYWNMLPFSSPRGSSWCRDWTHVSYIGSYQGSPFKSGGYYISWFEFYEHCKEYVRFLNNWLYYLWRSYECIHFNIVIEYLYSSW